MYWLPTRNLQTMVTNTMKATIRDDRLYPPKQRSLNFLDFQEMTWQGGSILWTNFFSSIILLKPKKFLWPPITWKGRPINGGSGFIRLSKKKDVLFLGQILKLNSGLVLGLQSAKILTKPFQGLGKLVPCVNTSENLNG